MVSYVEARNQNRKKLERAHRAGEKGNHAKAERLYRQYIKHFPNDPQVLYNLGVLVQRRAKNAAEFHEAGAFYQQAINSAEVEPFIKSNAMSNFGMIMLKLDHVDKAGICFHLALQMNPGNLAAKINFGDVLRHNGEYEEADRQFAEVLRLDPESDTAKFSAGMIALMIGDLKRGFDLYESRWGTQQFQDKPFRSRNPMWHGEDLNGKTILICKEQGHGDVIMTARYTREFKKRWPDCTVWFGCEPGLVDLMNGCVGVDKAMSDILDHTTFDYHVPCMSLPHRFGTTLDTIPNECPYILPHPSWRKIEFPTTGKGKRIGLVWAGSHKHGKDKWRSIEPEAFQPLIDAHPEYQFHSLQCGPKADECERLRGVIDLAPFIEQWSDTAQILPHLDLLISVDTAIVHLAGAVDVPCWMLTPFSCDFRWRTETERSEWYPKLRLVRQEKPEQWGPVLERINKAL